MTIQPLIAAAAALLLASAAVAQDTTSAPATSAPATTRPSSVTLTGTITSKTPVTKLVAVDRVWADVLKVSKDDPQDEFVYPATIDAAGKFSVPRLLPGRTYDLIAWTKPNAGPPVRWEGVTMDYHRPIKPDKPFEPDDRKWIDEFLTQTPQFYDKCRPLWMAADHKHATVLVELARTDAFYSSKGGEVIYRAELWYFENLFGGWAKDKNTERVISRWRGQGEKLPAWQYLPQIGGIAIRDDGTFDPINASLPEKPDPKRGTTGGLKK